MAKVRKREDEEFEGKKYEGSGDEAKLHGDLTIRGTTKPITVNVEFGGIAKDPWGMTRAGFTLTGKINRKDYGLKYKDAAATGEAVVSDDVEFTLDAVLIKQ